jgi:hypothetical protein
MRHGATFVIYWPRCRPTPPTAKPSLSSSHNPSATRYSAHPCFLRTQTDEWQQKRCGTMPHSCYVVLDIPIHNTCTHTSLPFPKRARGVFFGNPHPHPSILLSRQARGVFNDDTCAPASLPFPKCARGSSSTIHTPHSFPPLSKRARGVFLTTHAHASLPFAKQARQSSSTIC